eukprot:6812032-Pyramimonas_sp.AAC.1
MLQPLTHHQLPPEVLASDPDLCAISHNWNELAAYSDGSIRAYNLNSQALAFAFTLDYHSAGKQCAAVATVMQYDNEKQDMLFIGDSFGGTTIWKCQSDLSSPPTVRRTNRNRVIIKPRSRRPKGPSTSTQQ